MHRERNGNGSGNGSYKRGDDMRANSQIDGHVRHRVGMRGADLDELQYGPLKGRAFVETEAAVKLADPELYCNAMEGGTLGLLGWVGEVVDEAVPGGTVILVKRRGRDGKRFERVQTVLGEEEGTVIGFFLPPMDLLDDETLQEQMDELFEAVRWELPDADKEEGGVRLLVLSREVLQNFGQKDGVRVERYWKGGEKPDWRTRSEEGWPEEVWQQERKEAREFLQYDYLPRLLEALERLEATGRYPGDLLFSKIRGAYHQLWIKSLGVLNMGTMWQDHRKLGDLKDVVRNWVKGLSGERDLLTGEKLKKGDMHHIIPRGALFKLCVLFAWENPDIVLRGYEAMFKSLAWLAGTGNFARMLETRHFGESLPELPEVQALIEKFVEWIDGSTQHPYNIAFLSRESHNLIHPDRWIQLEIASLLLAISNGKLKISDLDEAGRQELIESMMREECRLMPEKGMDADLVHDFVRVARALLGVYWNTKYDYVLMGRAIAMTEEAVLNREVDKHMQWYKGEKIASLALSTIRFKAVEMVRAVIGRVGLGTDEAIDEMVMEDEKRGVPF